MVSSQGPVPRGVEVVDGLHVTHENAHRVLGGLVGVTGDYAKCESVSELFGALLSTGGHGLRSIMHTGADSTQTTSSK